METSKRSLKKTYHAGFRFGFMLGVLPRNEIDRIPKSTKHDWDIAQHDGLYGYDWVEKNKLVLENAILSARLDNVVLTNKILLLILALQSFIRKNKKNINSLHQNVVLVVLNKIEFLKKCKIPMYRILKLVGVSKKWYHHLKHNTCTKSPVKFCLLANPNQLIPAEIEYLYEFYRNPAHKFLSNINIYYEMRIQGKANYSINTFYNLIRQQGLKRPRVKSRRRNPQVLKAESVLSVLHIDVTKQRCLNGELGYIYVFKDNFSTFLLEVQCHRVLRTDIVVDCLALLNKRYNLKKLQSVQLITDGGSENMKISEWIRGLKNSTISHVIDKKNGLTFSNSMVEASNKLIKYRFLYHHVLADYNTLKKLVSQVAGVLNNQRISTIQGLTPYEKFCGLTAANLFGEVQHIITKEDRIKQNTIVNGCHWINKKTPNLCS
jgi:putative transposase